MLVYIPHIPHTPHTPVTENFFKLSAFKTLIFNLLYIKILLLPLHSLTTFNFQHNMKRKDLAIMYFPDKTPDQAVRNLRRWIENCPDLVAALKEIGMPRKHKKDLTARQVRIIMEYLGDP